VQNFRKEISESLELTSSKKRAQGRPKQKRNKQMKINTKIIYPIRTRRFELASLLVLVLLAAGVTPCALGQQQAFGLSREINLPEEVCTGGWSAGPGMPSVGTRLTGVFYPANGKFYAMGGRSSDGGGSEFTHPFEYDPVADNWTTKTATYPDNQVGNMGCAVLNDSGTDYIYCVGGNAVNLVTTGRVFRYNPITDSISIVPSPWPRGADGYLPGGFTVLQNKLYILGGFFPAVGALDQIWEFTPTTNVWTHKSAVLPVQLGFIPTTTVGSLIYTGGGSTGTFGIPEDSDYSFVYDPVADTIGTIANIPRATGETQALTFNDGSGAKM
jgi:hypothetical protein